METETLETKEEQAAFSAGFNDEAQTEKNPEPAKPTEDPKPEEPKPEEPAAMPALTAEEIAAFRQSAAQVAELQGKLRNAQGHIGTLTDRLNEFAKQKKEEGKPPTMTALELKKTKEMYPDLAETITPDLVEMLAKLQPHTNPEDAAKLVREHVAEELSRERVELRRDIVRSHHRDFDKVIAADDFKEWVRQLPDADRAVIETSASPDEIVESLNTFKTWRASRAKAKAKDTSQERLEQAITPTGERRPTSRSNLPPDEAMRKGFEEGFNS